MKITVRFMHVDTKTGKRSSESLKFPTVKQAENWVKRIQTLNNIESSFYLEDFDIENPQHTN